MTEVLYTMRNGKIVDPNIPMDGLVCYLDARGKTNTDKHRGTLLDLSGNGNHGTLQNFNFTEESGYVKDLSGRLKFDGVDDRLILQKEVYVSNINSTIYMKSKVHNIIVKATYRTLFVLGDRTSNNSAWSCYWLFASSEYGGDSGDISIQFFPEDKRYITDRLMTNVGSEIELEVVLRLTDNEIYVNVNGLAKTIPHNPIEKELELRIGNHTDSVNPDNYMTTLALENLKVWNRALTDEEIQQLMEV